MNGIDLCGRCGCRMHSEPCDASLHGEPGCARGIRSDVFQCMLITEMNMRLDKLTHVVGVLGQMIAERIEKDARNDPKIVRIH